MTKEGDKFNHIELPPEMKPVLKAIHRIDGFPWGGETIKESLAQAASSGEIGLFILDCLVAQPKATPTGLGKLLCNKENQIIDGSTIIYQQDSLAYLAGVLSHAGLRVSLWVFLGDDDWQYSVSPEFGYTQNPNLSKGIQAQINTIRGYLYTQKGLLANGVEINVTGWLSQELRFNLFSGRQQILQVIQTAFNDGKLPEKASKRLKQFESFRLQLITQSGLSSGGFQEMINEQTIQELASFASQGYWAPWVIHQARPKLPLIFLNTYPDLATQFLDDECVRLINHLGDYGYRGSCQHGTIHLPGPKRLAKFLQGAKIISRGGKMLTCGDPKGNPNY